MFAPFEGVGVLTLQYCKNEKLVLELIQDRIRKVGAGISKSDLEKTKQQSIGVIEIESEDCFEEVLRMAEEVVRYGSFVSPDERIRKVQEVSLEQVNDVAARYFKVDQVSTLRYGPW